jgi:hypothetical protein
MLHEALGMMDYCSDISSVADSSARDDVDEIIFNEPNFRIAEEFLDGD